MELPYLFQALVDGKYMKIWHPPPLDTASGAVAARSVAAWRSILMTEMFPRTKVNAKLSAKKRESK